MLPLAEAAPSIECNEVAAARGGIGKQRVVAGPPHAVDARMDMGWRALAHSRRGLHAGRGEGLDPVNRSGSQHGYPSPLPHYLLRHAVHDGFAGPRSDEIDREVGDSDQTSITNLESSARTWSYFDGIEGQRSH